MGLPHSADALASASETPSTGPSFSKSASEPSSNNGSFDGSIFRTNSSISLPGLNVTTFFDGTYTLSPVRGLRAFRGARCLTSKTPKLRSSIRPSETRVSNDGVESSLNNVLGLELSQTDVFRDPFDDFFLGHDSCLHECVVGPWGRKWLKCIGGLE